MTIRSRAGFRPPTSRCGPGIFGGSYSDFAFLDLISGKQGILPCGTTIGSGTVNYDQWGKRGQ
ncbi:hypothetical protein [Mycobacterium sp. 155]|uniref:hypothetical protein n=1 Tax=Mycobacterium sp. 155 TaxID=1157943 RepID=UPI000362954E|nr:hypothetical protein [Mycobacterium sp. 155]